jgi:diguanylate cyclase (GGDEF)-like protein
MVAGRYRPEDIDPSGVRKMLRLIESLRDSPAGSMIYQQVEAMLDEVATNHLKAEMAYAGFVSSLLDAFAAHFAPGSPEYIQIRLLQARLQPPLTATELVTLGEFVNQCAERIQNTRELETPAFKQAISPLLQAFGIQAAPAVQETVAVGESQSEHAETVPDDYDALAGVLRSRPDVDPAVMPDEGADESPEIADEEEKEAGNGEDMGAGEEAAAVTLPVSELGDNYRDELEARREDIQQLQSALGRQVLETITQNEEFGVVLETALAELRQAGDMSGVENVRWTLIREIEKLMKGHNELADKLDSTHHYLQLIESDSRELTDELTRVRLLSLTDELTGLPNRRAFMRRMEDEVARVQRYGFPLSFALMDLDHFKGINDEYGHAAGDEVLRVYSKNILSIFRHHDMVSRYGGEEFAVLLPNTDADGAIRALNKVKRRAAETRWQCNGTIAQVPSFSAGVSLFKPGESASAFIERADKALYRAKRLGRDRIELDITYETEDSGRTPRRRSTDL